MIFYTNSIVDPARINLSVKQVFFLTKTLNPNMHATRLLSNLLLSPASTLVIIGLLKRTSHQSTNASRSSANRRTLLLRICSSLISRFFKDCQGELFVFSLVFPKISPCSTRKCVNTGAHTFIFCHINSIPNIPFCHIHAIVHFYVS